MAVVALVKCRDYDPSRVEDAVREAVELLPGFEEGSPVADMNGWDIGRGFLEDARALHPLKEIRRYRGPALIIHGTRDESVPPSDAEDYHRALGANSELRFVKDADHVFSSFAWKEEVIARSRGFLLEALEAKPGC